jgi:hypothetical protein
MTFTATITYRIHNGEIMTKVEKDVEKVERTWEKLNGENIEVVRVYTRTQTWATWASGSIINIILTA